MLKRTLTAAVLFAVLAAGAPAGAATNCLCIGFAGGSGCGGSGGIGGSFLKLPLCGPAPCSFI